MLNKQYIGHALTAFEVPVEVGRLRLFAKAIGERNPVYTDLAAARDAGYPGLPVPPTYLFCLEMDAPDPAEMKTLLGIELAHLLHGEQHFSYERMVFSGDVLRFEPRVADVYEKKGGALEFAVRDTRVSNQFGQHVADLRWTGVVRRA